MFVTKPYDRLHAQEYALSFALQRNLLFPDYTGLGGDCTNFVSQCLLAGCCEMNYTPTYGWYYISPDERAPAWTGVQYLYNFLTQNTANGPFAKEVRASGAELCDIVQLGNRSAGFYHTLIITGFERNTFLVSAHSDDARNRPLNSYQYQRIRFLHIEGVRFEMPSAQGCFSALIQQKDILTKDDSADFGQPQAPQEEQTVPLQLEPEMAEEDFGGDDRT